MKVRRPGELKSYFQIEKKNLALVAATGIIYNVGLTAGPFFEGRMVQRLYDVSQGRKTVEDMFALVALYLVVIAVVQGCRAVKRFYTRRFANNTSLHMRTMLYNSLVHADKEEIKSHRLGAVMTRAISDVDACAEGMRKVTTEVFDTGVVMVAYAALLCFYDARLALLACVFIPIAYVAAERCKGVVYRNNERYKRNADVLNQKTLDLVGNAMTWRVFGLERERQSSYEGTLGAYERSAVLANVWTSALQPIYFAIAICGAIMIFIFGSRNVLGVGWTVWDVGAFTTFFACFTRFALKSSKAANLFNSVQKARASWRRIQPMFRDYVEDASATPGEVGTLAFKDVSVNYPGRPTVVSNLNFELKPGETLGVTGEVASGKSAIGKIFAGEAEYQGDVLVDGRQWSDLTEDERAGLVVYMGHNPELLSVDILENILLEERKRGPNDVAEQEEKALRALQAVCMDEEVRQTPLGLQTVVGDAGARLSGGQQARLALARSLANSRKILVLDDPFAALDRKTEGTVFKNLMADSANRITIIFSHRLDFFPMTDQVLFIQNGTAICGTHQEMMTNPEYARLYRLQQSVKTPDAGGEPEGGRA
ncbi:MAG: ABC transporter ATP-binding protein [Thermoguttaceae bacterium]|jgi:ATP-binding cassette subfamily B multidrug efflux pump